MLTRFINSRLSMYLFGLLIVAMTYIFYNQSMIRKLKRDIKDNKEVIKSESIEGRAWKDDANAWRYRTEITKLESSAGLQNYEAMNKNLLALTREFYGVKNNLRNVKAITNTVTNTVLERKILIRDTIYIDHKNDTILARNFRLQDTYTSITGTILKDTVLIKISNTDSIISAMFWTRRWFLGKKHYKQDLKSSNPNTKIVFSQSVIVNKL